MKRRLRRLKPNNPPRENAMTFQLSHVAIPVTDMGAMRRFYTKTLGFVVTDQKGEYPGETVFMSANPNEHHQVVLAASGGTVETDAVLGHFAMRVSSLEELKTVFNSRDFASVKNIVNKNDATLEILKNMNEKNNFKGYSIALNNLKKQINVSKTLVINSIESTKLSEVFRSKKSKKFLFAVVNPKRGNMNKHKKTINVIRRIKNIKKNISK